MKKKILFLLYSMNVGGVEKSLINLLSVFPREKFDLHIGLVHLEGGLLESLPVDITIHTITDISNHWNELKEPPLHTIELYTRTGRLIKAFYALMAYLACKIKGNYMAWTHFILKDTKGLEGSFDLAVAYDGPSSDIDYYICNKVQAGKKIGWVHFDVSKFWTDKGVIKQLFRQYERIFVVSETGKKIFDQIFPQFKDKTEVFHNVVLHRQIIEQSEYGDTFGDEFKGKRILTVGRISPEKGQLVAIKALKDLIDRGHNLRWYFVGGGSCLNDYRREVEQLGLSEDVIFLGTKTNPYAYMRDCDIYMQPSRHEGFCITLAEALCFGNPIVATDFTGARDQLKERGNAFVVGMSVENIVEGIEKALLVPKMTDIHNMDNLDIQKLLQLL